MSNGTPGALRVPCVYGALEPAPSNRKVRHSLHTGASSNTKSKTDTEHNSYGAHSKSFVVSALTFALKAFKVLVISFRQPTPRPHQSYRINMAILVFGVYAKILSNVLPLITASGKGHVSVGMVLVVNLPTSHTD